MIFPSPLPQAPYILLDYADGRFTVQEVIDHVAYRLLPPEHQALFFRVDSGVLAAYEAHVHAGKVFHALFLSLERERAARRDNLARASELTQAAEALDGYDDASARARGALLNMAAVLRGDVPR